jgi:hypothetical protein
MIALNTFFINAADQEPGEAQLEHSQARAKSNRNQLTADLLTMELIVFSVLPDAIRGG